MAPSKATDGHGLADIKDAIRVNNCKSSEATTAPVSSPTNPLIPTLEASLQFSEEEPILLDTSIDSAVTNTFLFTPQTFDGRAFDKKSSVVLPRHRNQERLSSGTQSSDTPSSVSTVCFVQDGSVSLLSRALETAATNDVDALNNPSNPRESASVSDLDLISKSSPSASLRGQSSPNGSASDPGIRVEASGTGSGPDETYCCGKYSKISSVFPMDTRNTIVKIENEHFQIPNSDLWLLSYDNERVMNADQIAYKIRPSFHSNVARLGPQKAIDAVNGRRLEPISTVTIPSDTTESFIDTLKAMIGRRGEFATAHSQNSSITGLVDRLEKLSGEVTNPVVGSYDSNAASNLPSENSFVPGRIELDGARERKQRPSCSPIQFMRSGAARSIGTPTSESGFEVDMDGLFRFVEGIREALPTQNIGDEDVEQLREILQVFLEAESEQSDEITTLSMITQIRFDRLLADLVDLRTVKPEYMEIVTMAHKLQHIWKERLQDDYLDIERERLQTMFSQGILHGLKLIVDAETNLSSWQIERGAPIADADLKPGHFWLNIESAYRDGVVESSTENLTLGRYGGTPTLPLLSGTEVLNMEHPGRTRYRRQCRAKDIPYKLMTRGEHFKGKIRILRGHELVSKFAPRGGVRYDGEYTITHWGLLPVPDFDIDIRHFELVLERIPGQRSVRSVPSPSQLDEWHLYQRYVALANSKALKVYSNLLTEELSLPNEPKQITHSDIETAGHDWHLEQIINEYTRVVEKAFKHQGKV